jgi:hypothetical protein
MRQGIPLLVVTHAQDQVGRLYLSSVQEDLVGASAVPEHPHGQDSGLMSFGIYIVGYLIVIAGLIYGAIVMHVPAQ